jgi:hypothetical protein
MTVIDNSDTIRELISALADAKAELGAFRTCLHDVQPFMLDGEDFYTFCRRIIRERNDAMAKRIELDAEACRMSVKMEGMADSLLELRKHRGKAETTAEFYEKLDAMHLAEINKLTGAANEVVKPHAQVADPSAALAKAQATDDTAFIPPFGTVRKCFDCGCLVAGGLGRCGLCAAALIEAMREP